MNYIFWKDLLKKERRYGVLIGAVLAMIFNAIALAFFYALEYGLITF